MSLDGSEDSEEEVADLVAEGALGGLGVGVEDKGVGDLHLMPIF